MSSSSEKCDRVDNEVDVATLDDVQFSASLDALLQGNTGSSSMVGDVQQNDKSSSCLNPAIPKPLDVSGSISRWDAGSTQSRVDGSQAASTVTARQAGSDTFSSGNVTNMPTFLLPAATQLSLSSRELFTNPHSNQPSTGNDSIGRRRKKRDFGSCQVSENEDEQERRRQDRNLREQQRSQLIASQIDVLKAILKSANIKFKPDRYSTLRKTATYVKQLQDHSNLLDQEHQNLLNTTRQTSEIVNSMYAPTRHGDDMKPDPAIFSNDLLADESTSLSPLEDETKGFGRGLDFKSIFLFSPVAFSLTSVDGRFLDCNKEFEELTGYPRKELLPMENRETGKEDDAGTVSSGETTRLGRNLSLFNVLKRDDMRRSFNAMSEMLQRNASDQWNGNVRLSRSRQVKDEEMRLSVKLMRTETGHPRFFSCSLLPP